MTRLRPSWVVGAPLCLAVIYPATAAAQGVVIDHRPVGCVVAGKFSRFDARFDPADQVARARIDFHADGDARWYFVEMTLAGGLYYGTLPRPLKETRKIQYYIEVMRKDLGQSRTEEYSPVVAGAGECGKKGLLTATPLGKAAVMVQRVPPPAAGPAGAGASASGAAGAVGSTGAATVPAGFAATGIAGAAPGVVAGVGAVAGGHGTAIVLGVVGAGAAAGGVVLAMRSSSPATTLPAGVTGRWTGSIVVNYSTAACTQQADVSDDLVQSGNTFTGTRVTTPRSSTCGDTPGPPFMSPVSGTINGINVTIVNNGNPSPGVSFESTCTGTLEGNRISGTCQGSVTVSGLPAPLPSTGTWQVQRQ